MGESKGKRDEEEEQEGLHFPPFFGLKKLSTKEKKRRKKKERKKERKKTIKNGQGAFVVAKKEENQPSQKIKKRETMKNIKINGPGFESDEENTLLDLDSLYRFSVLNLAVLIVS